MHQDFLVACWVTTGADLKVKSGGLDRMDLCFLLGQGTVLPGFRIEERRTDSVRPGGMGASLLMR